jgi:hypothetical protein
LVVDLMFHSISGAPKALANLVRQHGLAGAGLTLDQQRAAQGDGGIDRDLEVVGGDVGLGAFELESFLARGASNKVWRFSNCRVPTIPRRPWPVNEELPFSA